jgi:chromosome segregation ATPase
MPCVCTPQDVDPSLLGPVLEVLAGLRAAAAAVQQQAAASAELQARLDNATAELQAAQAAASAAKQLPPAQAGMSLSDSSVAALEAQLQMQRQQNVQLMLHLAAATAAGGRSTVDAKQQEVVHEAEGLLLKAGAVQPGSPVQQEQPEQQEVLAQQLAAATRKVHKLTATRSKLETILGDMEAAHAQERQQLKQQLAAANQGLCQASQQLSDGHEQLRATQQQLAQACQQLALAQEQQADAEEQVLELQQQLAAAHGQQQHAAARNPPALAAHHRAAQVGGRHPTAARCQGRHETEASAAAPPKRPTAGHLQPGGIGALGPPGGWQGGPPTQLLHSLPFSRPPHSASPPPSFLPQPSPGCQVIALVERAGPSGVEEALAAATAQMAELQHSLAEAGAARRGLDKEAARLRRALADEQAERGALEERMLQRLDDMGDDVAQV